MTVCGPVEPSQLGAVDAHSHVWIEPPSGTKPNAPRLADFEPILAEMKEFREAGGGAIVDCQPGSCGRDGNRLRQLSQASGVAVIASTGFHRRVYYPDGWWLWSAAVDQVTKYFVEEVRGGLRETREQAEPVRAGLIKCACEATVQDTPQAALEAAAAAAAELGICVEAHTEKGVEAETIVKFFEQRGVRLAQLVLCHMDKRPDFELHKNLASAGVMLEYDTFFRPKYDPDRNAWPLIEKMIANGFDGRLALATDMAEASTWKQLGGGPGMAGFLTRIWARLAQMGTKAESIRRLMGGNIAQRLAGAG